MVTRTRALFGVAVAVAFATGCALVAGIKDRDFQIAPSEAGSDAEPDQAAPLPSCIHAAPPGPPSDGGNGERSFVFAIRTYDFSGVNAANVPVGFDLDGVCTCDPIDRSPLDGGSTCKLPAAPLVPGACDGPGGIDNAAVGLSATFGALAQGPMGQSLADEVNLATACGRQTLLLSVSGYNGGADDPSVVVAAIFSRGIRVEHDGGTDPTDGGCAAAMAPWPAKWDGKDLWSVPTGTVERLTGNANPISFFTGWVRDWKLVVDQRAAKSGPHVPLVFGDKTVDSAQSVIVARLVPLDELDHEILDGSRPFKFRLAEGVLAGRATAASVLSAVGSFRVKKGMDGGTDEFLCDPSLKTIYGELKKTCCAARDVTIDPMASPDQPCDGVSAAVQFTAETALIGDDFDPLVVDAGICGAEFTDNCP